MKQMITPLNLIGYEVLAEHKFWPDWTVLGAWLKKSAPEKQFMDWESSRFRRTPPRNSSKRPDQDCLSAPTQTVLRVRPTGCSIGSEPSANHSALGAEASSLIHFGLLNNWYPQF
jgi:hypothetical protein